MSHNPLRKYCLTCLYFASPESGIIGQCHRHSPLAARDKYGKDSEMKTYWPKVSQTDSCGDHQDILEDK